MIFVYEDDAVSDLLPLTSFRPVFDLLCGTRTLLAKFCSLYPRERFGLLVRPELAPLVVESLERDAANKSSTAVAGLPLKPAPPVLFLNGRSIFDKALPVAGREEVFTTGESIVAFRVRPERIRRLPVRAQDIAAWRLPRRNIPATVLRYPWDLLTQNRPQLERELRGLRPARSVPGITVIGRPAGLAIARTAEIDPGVTFDLRAGRVFIDAGAKVRAGSIVAGPCYVGKGTVIDAARVRPGCSFGPECRIGGEVEASVFQGYANKHHEGFIGHALVGEWVNLGALTTNSDLRNDYAEVMVELNGRRLNTGRRLFGCIIGDHAKTAIGTLLNTGTCIGIFANWFRPGLSDKSIPAFGWSDGRTWPLAAALATARLVMQRRGVALSPSYEQLIRRYHAQTQKSR
jgi:UDP-N-acetylglucosamine diphosphorylase/glucosamine-1-phosphate N-acetyltransferase